ncbi:rubrerythrin family protein [Desulfocurvus sp. DL9XJH121]
MSKTEKNLKAAFAGESQANRKYLAFADKADKEGHAAAAAETVHAHNHLRALGGIGTTEENLKEALGGETYEFTEMYPPMIEDAEAEGNKAALISFTSANTVEATHAELYKKALETLDDPEPVDCYYVCSVCGHTVANHAPDTCPVCKAAAKAFNRID